MVFFDLDPGVLGEDLDSPARGDLLVTGFHLAHGQVADGGLEALEEPAVRDGQVVLLLVAVTVCVGGIHAACG